MIYVAYCHITEEMHPSHNCWYEESYFFLYTIAIVITCLVLRAFVFYSLFVDSTVEVPKEFIYCFVVLVNGLEPPHRKSASCGCIETVKAPVSIASFKAHLPLRIFLQAFSLLSLRMTPQRP